MLVVAGEIEIDPAHREEAVDAMQAMMTATRRESGCRSYVLSADLGDPGRFRIFEEWESQEDLDAHMETPHMKAFQASLAKLGVRRLDVKRYEVGSVTPLT